MKPSDVKSVNEMINAAKELEEALLKFNMTVMSYQNKAKDPFTAHQLVCQAITLSGIPKSMDIMKSMQDDLLKKLPRYKSVVTETATVGDLILPSYIYTPTERESAKLMDRHNDGDFMLVLKAAVKLNRPRAIQRRLVSSEFDKKMLVECGGVVNISTEETWSIKKAK